MNKKLIYILIAMICVMVTVTVIGTVTVPTAAVWVDEGSASGNAEDIPANWNANLKYMMFKIILSDGSLTDISTTAPLLEYDANADRLQLISDSSVYVTGMAFSGYTGALADVNIPPAKTIVVSGQDYSIPVTEVTNMAFATSRNLVQTIFFPSTVHTIAANTCAHMSALKSVVIQSDEGADYRLSIGNSAFMNCSSLKTVTFNGDWNTSSTINIGTYAFMACVKMEEIWFNSTTAKTPTFSQNVFFGTLPTFNAFMIVENRSAYVPAIGAARCVGFYDVEVANTSLSAINNSLTWYQNKACTVVVETPTSVDEGRYFAK